jgi:hypothetical protein
MVWTYNKRTHMPESIPPPQMAALLLSVFASEPDFPQIEGDLREEFHQHRQMNGLRSARRWYWRETFRNVLALIKRPRILQALALAALCVVIIRIAYPPFVIWLRIELRESPLRPVLYVFLLFLFRPCLSLALGILAGHMLRGRERLLVLAFTIFYLLPSSLTTGVLFLPFLWKIQSPLYIRGSSFILWISPIFSFWIATRWSARRNGQRRIA